MNKFRTKNALFGYFWARILKFFFSYLKSATLNLPKCNFCEEAKMLKFWTKNAILRHFLTKNALFWYFSQEF